MNDSLFPLKSAIEESNGEISATTRNENDSAYEYNALLLNSLPMKWTVPLFIDFVTDE
jgi:hypothetical protein